MGRGTKPCEAPATSNENAAWCQFLADSLFEGRLNVLIGWIWKMGEERCFALEHMMNPLDEGFFYAGTKAEELQ